MAQLVIEASVGNYWLAWEQNVPPTRTYAQIHDAASADAVELDSLDIGQLYDYEVSGDYFYVYRAGLVFDISSIPSGAVISAAPLSLYGGGDYSDTDFDITLVSGADLADTFVLADYGDLLNDTTSFGALTTVGLVIDGWNVITLNAAGLAALQAAIAGGSGKFRLGIRSSRDISSTTPKLDGVDANEEVYFAGHGTAGTRPKLTITYSILTVTTDPATSVGQTTATLNGTLADDGGESCDVSFEYGETTAYGTATAIQSKTIGQTFLQEVRGLKSGTVYHFRAKATNSAGTVYGADRIFHTTALTTAAHEAMGKSYPLGRAEV